MRTCTGVRACAGVCACAGVRARAPVCARAKRASGFSYLRRREVGDGRGPAPRRRRQVRAVPAVEERLGPGGPGGREPAEQQDAGGEHGPARARARAPACAPAAALPGRAMRSLLYAATAGPAFLTQARSVPTWRPQQALRALPFEDPSTTPLAGVRTPPLAACAVRHSLPRPQVITSRTCSRLWIAFLW